MTWPQLYVLAAMIVSTVVGIATEARDKGRTNTFVVVYILLALALRATMAIVLHAGGFW